VYPLANLLATEQVHLGDLIRIDWDGEHKQLTFVRESEGALVENPPLPMTKTATATEAHDGRALDAPAEVVAEERKTRAASPASGPGPAPSSRKKPER
jgi:hypothetical protein